MRWGFDHSLPSGPASLPHEAFALRMELTLSDGDDHWRNLIALITRLAHAR
jgi:hypothetical protein